MEDEGGRVNINRAGPRLLKAMLSGFALSDEEKAIIVDSIQDWRDGDNFHRLHGAEEAYYQSLPEPYHARNGDFASPSELKLVRGITVEMFESGLKEMVTVFPGRPTPAALSRRGAVSGTGGRRARIPFNYDRVNVNAAPRALLRSLPGMSDALADAVVAYREAALFRSIADLISVLGADAYGVVAPYLAIQDSDVYAITAIGHAAGKGGSDPSGAGLRRGVRAVVEVSTGRERPYRILAWLDNIDAE
jgi:general secretion pathway protein K